MDPRSATNRIELVTGDTGPQVQLTLTDATTGAAINLVGATATIYMRLEGGSTVDVTRPLYIPSTTAADGVAVVVWEAGDLDIEAGDYEGEVEVVLASGITQTLYDPLKFVVRAEF